jgi:hypothetical protein
MKLTKFIKKNKTMFIVVMTVMTVIVFFISFQKWNSNNITTEHYNPNKQESSMMDQLLYNSTQYYNHNKNNFLAKTEASGYTPPIPKPGEHCPVASWYGDRIWTNDGIRTSRLNNKENGGVDFENNITDYKTNIPGTSAFKYEYKENDKNIIRRLVTGGIKNNIEYCNKPCGGNWKLFGGENLTSLKFDVQNLNQANDKIWRIKWSHEMQFGDFNDGIPPIISKGDYALLTVSNTTLYAVPVIVDGGNNVLKSCKNTKGRPCEKMGLIDTMLEVIINFTSDVDTVKTLIHSIIEIDVEKNSKSMWMIAKIKDEDGNPSIGRLYKGTFATIDVDNVKRQTLGLSIVEGIQKVGDDATVEDNVTELSVSDNHVLIKVVGGTSESQYQILKKGNSKWEIIETPGEGVNLTVVSDNRNTDV